MSNARAKFEPRSWLVPICSARRSPISASPVSVTSAPGNFSASLLRPLIVGIASQSCQISRYTSSIRSASSRASAAAGMERVTFLPQEFGRAQERPRAKFPADHVRPLVHEHGQVAIALDQVAVDGADHRLGGGPDREALGELVGAAVGDPGDLRAEPFDVLGLGLEEALGHEQRQVDVLVARLLDPPVERVAHVLPQREAIRADDDAAPDGRIGRELGVADDVEIPLAEIGRSGARERLDAGADIGRAPRSLGDRDDGSSRVGGADAVRLEPDRASEESRTAHRRPSIAHLDGLPVARSVSGQHTLLTTCASATLTSVDPQAGYSDVAQRPVARWFRLARTILRMASSRRDSIRG